MQRSSLRIGLSLFTLSAWLSPLQTAAADLAIAHVAPGAGASASAARAFGDGARLYFDRVNAQGGVAGATIAFETRDLPQADDGDALAAMLAARHPILIVGAISRESASLLPTLERLQVPLLGPAADGDRPPAMDNRYVFTIEPDPVAEIDALLDKVAGLGLRKIAVCAPRDTAVAYSAGSPLAILQRNAAPIAVQRCDGETPDVEASARAIATTRPQAVIVAGSTRDATIFVNALRAQESRAMVVTTSAVDPAALAAALPPSARIWIVGGDSVPGPRRGKDGAASSTLAEFLELRGAAGSTLAVSRASLAGFATAKMAVEAMRRAGAHPSGADMRKALAAMQRYDAARLAANDLRDRANGP